MSEAKNLRDGSLYFPNPKSNQDYQDLRIIRIFNPKSNQDYQDLRIIRIFNPKSKIKNPTRRLGDSLQEIKDGKIINIFQAIISWKRNEHPIGPTDKYEIRQNDTHSILIIKKVNENDHGNYTCVATNSIGMTKQNILIYICEVERQREN